MAKVIFKESDHTYWLEDRRLISVTQLLKKHGLAQSFDDVDEEVLKSAAERGTMIHREIENYIKSGELGFTSEFMDFMDIVDEMALCKMQSETIVHDDLIAGTVDIMGVSMLSGEGLKVIADIKTGAKIDKRACAWQLSLYEYLSGEKFDGGLFVFHLGKSSKVIAVERIPEKEIYRLLECERNGEIYEEQGLLVTTDILERALAAERLLKEIEEQRTIAEETAKKYRQILYEAMGAQNISSWETRDKSMLITRVEPTVRVSIDSTRLKKEMPEIAEKYIKKTNVNGYVKITLREA